MTALLLGSFLPSGQEEGERQRGTGVSWRSVPFIKELSSVFQLATFACVSLVVKGSHDLWLQGRLGSEVFLPDTL